MCSSGLVQAPSQLLMGALQGRGRRQGRGARVALLLNHLFGSVFSDLGTLEVAGAEGTAWDWLG